MDKPFPPLRGSPITVKSVFASKTAIGIVLALAAKVFGVAGDDLNSVATHALALWPILVGVLADVGALIARLRLTQFDRSILSRPDFYLQIVSGIATVAAAFGYDLSALQGILAKGIDAWPAIVALAGGLIGIFGSLTAKDKLKISVPKTRILPLLILVSLALPSYAQEPLDTCCAVRIKPTVLTGVAQLWSKNDKLWPQRATLRILFLNGTNNERSKAWREFSEIDALVNLTLVKVSTEPSDIRVQFDITKGHWSYVGTDCRRVKATEPTMNLGLRNLDFRGEWRRVAQHELLHALGFEHEHQSPNSTIPWNKEAVYAYYGQTQGWSRSQIKFQVLDRYTGLNWQGTRFDPTSIMQYPIPGQLTDYKLHVGWISRRSKFDDAELARRYPN
jgi:serralysin